MIHRIPALLCPLTLAVAACSPASEPPANDALPQAIPTATPAPRPDPSPLPSPSAATAVIGLDGLGALKIGKPVAAGSGWGERGARIEGPCRTVTSAAYPGVYAIVENGKVARISVGRGSSVKLVEGIGVGATEQQVAGWFGGFREEPHKYEPAPAKYLTAPNAASGDPALRFEIGRDGRVAAIHVGTMPVLGYVEGCA